MNDYIIDKMKEWLKKNVCGKANAKPRKELREYIIYGLHYDISDRAMRRAYASFNHVGYSSKGIYWIEDQADLRNFKDRQQTRAVAIFARTKKTEIEVEDERQLELGR